MKGVESVDYLQKVFALLGSHSKREIAPEVWQRVEAEVGFELPDDFKEITAAYAPTKLNGHLYLLHPSTIRWNLLEEIRSDIEILSGIDWSDELEEGSINSMGVERLEFGTARGLAPIVSTDGGQTIFIAKLDNDWTFFTEDGEGEFTEYRMSFSEWLFRYLSGEDCFGPNSSHFYPGPVKIMDLPLVAIKDPPIRYGPPRSCGEISGGGDLS